MTNEEMNKIADLVVEKLLVKLDTTPAETPTEGDKETVKEVNLWPFHHFTGIKMIDIPQWYWADPNLYNPFSGVVTYGPRVPTLASTSGVGG